jgi:dephospho-CoA kinase
MDIELKRKMADFVIDNTGSLEETKRQVEKLVEILRRKLKEKKANP